MSGGEKDDLEDAHAPTIEAVALAETIDSPAAPVASPKRMLTLEQADRYEVRGELGRGGIGRVLLVFDSHLGREVARKELLSQASPGDGAVSIGAAARFLREARITGQLEHPGIVPVYELGQREDGSLYYTMRRIRGRSLAKVLEGASTLEERLKLLGHFRGVCEAVAYAHSHGVVHRDLKPDNVMIGEFGETLVVDWGLAKVRGESDERGLEIERRVSLLKLPGAAATIDGHAIGTPAYMSPEQARGDLDAIDERSDVWGLGAMLYELLTGRPPHKGERAIEILRSVLEDRPPRVRDVAPGAPPELAAIADRALTADPSSRYPSGRELAAEIAAYQDGDRVHAYDYGSVDLVRRFARRNKAATIAALVVLVAVIGAVIFSYDRYRGESAARAYAEAQMSDAVEQRRRAQRGEETAESAVAEALLERAQRALGEGDPAAAAIYAAGALARDPARERSHERSARALSVYIDAEDTRRFVYVRRIDGADARAQLTPDGRSLVIVAGSDLVIEDLASGERRTLEGAGGELLAVLDSERAIMGGERSAVISLADGARLFELPEGGIDAAIGGDRFALSTRAGVISIFDNTSYAERDRFGVPRHGRTMLAWAGAHLFAVALDEAEVLRWPWPRSGLPDPARIALSSPPSVIAASPDGARIAVGHPDPGIDVFAAHPFERQPAVRGRGWTSDLRWLSGDLLASAENGMVVVRDMPDGTKLDTLHVPPNHGLHVESARGHRYLVALPMPESTRMPRASLFRWERESGGGARSFDESVRYLVEDRTRDRYIVATLRAIWALPIVRGRLGPPARIAAIPNEHGHPVSLAVNVDGAIAIVTSRGAVLLYERDAPELALVFEGTARRACLFGVAFDPSGDVLYAGDPRGMIRRFRRSRRAAIDSLFGHEDAVCGLAVRRDGRVASASLDGTVRFWDPRTGRQLREISIGHVQASDVAFDPSGQRVAIGDDLGFVHLYDAEGEPIVRFAAHDDWVNRIAWSPDGQRLATSSDDGTVRIFSRSGARLDRVVRAGGLPLAVSFGSESLVLHDPGSVLRVRADSAYATYDPAELLRRAEARAGVELEGLELVAR